MRIGGNRVDGMDRKNAQRIARIPNTNTNVIGSLSKGNNSIAESYALLCTPSLFSHASDSYSLLTRV